MNKRIWKKRIAEAVAVALLLGALPIGFAGMNQQNTITAYAGGGEDDGQDTVTDQVDVPVADPMPAPTDDSVQDRTTPDDVTQDSTVPDDTTQDDVTQNTVSDPDVTPLDDQTPDAQDDTPDTADTDTTDGVDDTQTTDDTQDTGDTGNTSDTEDTDSDKDDTANEFEDADGGDEEDKTLPGCICGERCTSFKWNENCPRCKDHKEECAYVEPNVKIEINAPNGWFKDAALVTFTIEDIAESGNFRIESIKAKISQNGSWVDVTEERRISISENCTVYVLVNDARGKQYEKNRYIECFDFTKPTLNASISNGRLSIVAQDNDSGVKAIYVDSHEFAELTNGTINIQLQKFDAGYEYFSIQALDHAGNLSDVYRIANPYYKDPAKEQSEDPAKDLPQSAEVAPPATAQAAVTDYSRTDTQGNNMTLPSATPSPSGASSTGSSTSTGDDEDNSSVSGRTETEPAALGKEFYTIVTQNGKVFYLVIDRMAEEPVTYFLTEITENDLLNVTQGAEEIQTMPQNAATSNEAALPVTETAYPNNNTGGTALDTTTQEEEPVAPEEPEVEEEPAEEEVVEEKKDSPIFGYILLLLLAGGAIGAYYFLKMRKRKGEDFIDEDEDDALDDEDEYYDDDEDEDAEDDDAFLDGADESDAEETDEESEDEEGYLDDDLPEDYAGSGELEFIDFDMDDAVADAVRDEERYVTQNEVTEDKTTTTQEVTDNE